MAKPVVEVDDFELGRDDSRAFSDCLLELEGWRDELDVPELVRVADFMRKFVGPIWRGCCSRTFDRVLLAKRDSTELSVGSTR